MSSQRESWMTIQKGYIVRHSENDGYAFMRKGAEESNEIIMSVKEAREIVYGMPYPKWKEKYQAEATSAQKKAFEQNIEK